MTFLNWTHDLDTGIDWIDEQHQQIVDYINELYEAREGNDHGQVGEVIEKLADYTVNHFSEEEEMMEAAGYRLTDLHKKVHEKFIAEVTALQKRHNAGQDASEDLLKMLENWLFSHIRSNDHGYVAIVKEAGADVR